jgi:hypothetical protein
MNAKSAGFFCGVLCAGALALSAQPAPTNAPAAIPPAAATVPAATTNAVAKPGTPPLPGVPPPLDDYYVRYGKILTPNNQATAYPFKLNMPFPDVGAVKVPSREELDIRDKIEQLATLSDDEIRQQLIQWPAFGKMSLSDDGAMLARLQVFRDYRHKIAAEARNRLGLVTLNPAQQAHFEDEFWKKKLQMDRQLAQQLEGPYKNAQRGPLPRIFLADRAGESPARPAETAEAAADQHRLTSAGEQSRPRALDGEGGHDGRVIARADGGLHHAGARFSGQMSARVDVVEPPADVAPAHFPPRRPPGEKALVGRRHRAAEIDQAAGQHPIENGALHRQLAGEFAAFLRMNVDGPVRDIEIAADHHRFLRLPERRREIFQRGEKAHLGGEILPAVRDVDGGEGDLPDRGDDDPVFHIEVGMPEFRLLR